MKKLEVGQILFVNTPGEKLTANTHRHVFLGEYKSNYIFGIITSTETTLRYQPYVKLLKNNYPNILKHDSYIGCGELALKIFSTKGQFICRKVLGILSENDANNILSHFKTKLKPDLYETLKTQITERKIIIVEDGFTS